MSKDNKKSLTQGQKQQKYKAITNHFAMNLAIWNPESELKKSYDNTCHCNSVKHYNGEKMTSTYCKNRWCYTCNRIRSAININQYAEQINDFGQPFFVTLTRPTCSIEELQNQIDEMEKAWRALYNLSKDKRKEPFKNGIFLKGIRTMECTIRPGGQYHYHMHMIVEGWTNAEWIVSEWLKRNPQSSVNAQDIRPANAGALSELFKYAIKMTVDLSKSDNFKRLDALFCILKGKRTLATFGGIKAAKEPKDEDFQVQGQFEEELYLRLGNEESLWSWEKDAFDWVNKATGEMLIGEQLEPEILRMCQKKVRE